MCYNENIFYINKYNGYSKTPSNKVLVLYYFNVLLYVNKSYILDLNVVIKF